MFPSFIYQEIMILRVFLHL